MLIQDFYVEDIALVKSCGEFACNGSHDADTPCPGYGSIHSPTTYAVAGTLTITKPAETMDTVIIPFRNRAMAELFIHADLLAKGPFSTAKLVDNFDVATCVDNVIAAYKTAGIEWHFVAWYKPTCKGK